MNDILKYIKELTEESTVNQIEKVLEKDIKDYSPNEDVRNEKDSIKKLLLFKEDYKQSKFDPDSTEQAKNIYKELQWCTNDDLGVYVQGDTMNSFFTTYKSAIINSNQNYNEMCVKANIKMNKGLLEQISKIIDNYELFKLNDELTNVFTDFARLTHTIGNLTLVPNGYNTLRNSNVKDYFDLTLEKVKEEGWKSFNKKGKEEDSKEILKWQKDFMGQIEKYCLQDYVDKYGNIIPLYEGHILYRKPYIPKIENEIIMCINEMNKRIRIRGLRMIMRINPKCSKVCTEMVNKIKSS